MCDLRGFDDAPETPGCQHQRIYGGALNLFAPVALVCTSGMMVVSRPGVSRSREEDGFVQSEPRAAMKTVPWPPEPRTWWPLGASVGSVCDERSRPCRRSRWPVLAKHDCVGTIDSRMAADLSHTFRQTKSRNQYIGPVCLSYPDRSPLSYGRIRL